MQQYCRICLAFDVKLHNLGDTEKKKFLERMFQHHGYYGVNRAHFTTTSQGNNENHNVCYICEALLTKSYSFIERALRAQKVLDDLMKRNDMKKAVNMLIDIDRLKCKLNYTDLSFKKLNIVSIAKSEAISCIKEEIVTDDNNLLNNNDMSNVENDNLDNAKPVNTLPNSFINEKNINIKEIEIKLGEPCIDIGMIHNKRLLNIATEENNPLDIAKEECNPLDIKTEEHNPFEIKTEGNNILDIMTENTLFEGEEYDPLDIMKEKTEMDNSSDSQCNDIQSVELESDDVLIEDEIGIQDLKSFHKKKKKSLHGNNKTTKLVPEEENVVDTDGDKTKKKKVNKQENKSNIQNPDTMDWEEYENIKEKNKIARKQAYKLRMASGNKPQTRKKRAITPEKIEDIIIEGKRKRKTTCIIDQDSDKSDLEEKERRKKEYKHKKGSDEDYAPDSNESSESECEREYPMTCEQCDSVISSKKEHFYHYLGSHPKIKYPYGNTRIRYVCEICGGRFYLKQHYQYHMLTHGEKTLQCPHCPKTFRAPVRLSAHVTRVHAAKRYVCDYCDKRFPDKGNLKLHIRTHTGEKPYRCHICSAGFAHNGNRLMHIRVKHQNLPYRTQEKLDQEKKQKRRKQRKKNETSDEEPLINKKRKKIKNKTKKRRTHKQRNKNSE